MAAAGSEAPVPSGHVRNDFMQFGSRADAHSSISTLHVDTTELEALSDKPKTHQPSQTKSPQRLRNGRIVRLMIFLALEFVWLGLGLLIRYVVAPASSTVVTGTRLTVAAMVWESRLFSVVIFLHTLIVFPMADLINEIYSGEWWWILGKLKTSRYDDPEVDRVSTLVSGRWEQFKHAFFGGHATLSYRLGFIMALLLLALQSVAPVAITTSYYPFFNDKKLAIGLLPANLTQSDNTDFDPFAAQRAQLSQSRANQLAQKVVRFEYVVQVEGNVPEFTIENGTSSDWDLNVLFGMPTRDVFGLFNGSIDRIEYKSDAVAYNFSCQWLAPTLVQASLPITWSFGGDMEGVIDLQSVVTTVTVPVSYGIYPLAITSGSGATNGSFAWFIFGLTDQSDLDLSIVSQDLGVFIDFSSLSASEKNVGNNDWSGIATKDRPLENDFSTTATVLFCDPHVKLGGVDILARDFGSTLVVKDFVENATFANNLDPIETKRMLGQSLNGIPWDSVVVIANNTPSKLSQLAVEFLFSQPQSDTPTFLPQDLSRISANLNSYTLIAGMTAYLDGSSDSTTVDATTFTDILALDINWTQWIMTLAIVLVIAVLVSILTVQDSRKRRRLVPFTLDVLREEYLPRVPVQQEKV